MKNNKKIVATLAVLSLVVVLLITLSFRAFRQIQTTAEARKQTFIVLNKSVNLLSALKDAETGQRGYLLTGDKSFMQHYLAVQGSVRGQLNDLLTLSLNSPARSHLVAMVPLVDAKMSDLADAITLRRTNGIAAVTAVLTGGQGKRLMDSIRDEMRAFIEMEEGLLTQREASFQSKMYGLFVIIVLASLLMLLFVILVTYFIRKESQQRLKNLVHLETEHLLVIQQELNDRLQEANVTLEEKGKTAQKLFNELENTQLEMEVQNTELLRSQQELENQQIELEMQNDDLRIAREVASKLEIVLRDSEQHLSVTLNSIGDAVIATDHEARVTRLNPVAEQLVGWTQAEAIGVVVDEIFHIVNKDTRLPAPIPVMDAIVHGTIQGLANHTVLISRDGSEYDIADSCAPIRNHDGKVVGAVLVFRNVTEEYAVQQSLSDSAALVQTILNTVVDGIITIHARGGIVETVNRTAEQMFGYSAAELNGQKFSLLIPELDRDLHNGSLDYYRASDEDRAHGRLREVLGRRRDGSIFPMEISVSEMQLKGQRYFTGILRDITVRKQTEEALLKTGALQNAIFNSANFSSIATDAKGVIQIFNVGAERMLGYTASEVMNKITPADISDPQEVIARAEALSIELGTSITPGFEALVFKASRCIEDIYELTYIRKDGSRFPAVVSVTALRDEHNAIIGYLLIGTDNTARKQVEAERVLLEQALQDKNVELERASLVAERANRAKSDFLSSMSHELRTPLSAILGFAQLIESGSPGPTPTQKRSVDQILKAGWYLLELINEILDLAVIESGKLSMSLEAISLPEIILDARPWWKPRRNNVA